MRASSSTATPTIDEDCDSDWDWECVWVCDSDCYLCRDLFIYCSSLAGDLWGILIHRIEFGCLDTEHSALYYRSLFSPS
jgi:hypothetical protein